MTDNRAQTPEQRFGMHVKQVRELRGWTQDQLARHVRDTSGIDIQQSGIARLEAGQRTVRLNEFMAISSLLGIDLADYTARAASLTDEAEYRTALQREREIQEQLGDAAARRDEATRSAEAASSEMAVLLAELHVLHDKIFSYRATQGSTSDADQV